MKSVVASSEILMLRRIGKRIHKYLFENNIPLETLAFRSDVARSTLREIVAGRSNLRLLTLHAIARGMGYSGVDEFLSSQQEDR